MTLKVVSATADQSSFLVPNNRGEISTGCLECQFIVAVMDTVAVGGAIDRFMNIVVSAGLQRRCRWSRDYKNIL